MKVLAINGSPRGASGNTERILQPFLEGAQGAGAETEVIYLKNKDHLKPVADAHGLRFRGILPANTLICADIIGSEYLVEIEAEALLG